MRQVVLFIASSLDGYIARTSGSVDWLFIVNEGQDYGHANFFDSVDTVLMGRRTYEQVLSLGEFLYKGTKCFVSSRTRRSEQDGYATFVSSNI